MNGVAAWRTGWLIVTTIGVGIGMLEWGPLAAFGCIAAVTVTTIPAVMAVRTFRPRDPTAPDGAWHRGLLRPAVISASAVVACWAVARLAPSVALLLLTLAVVSSPVVVRLLRRMTGHGPVQRERVVVRPAGAAPRVVRQAADGPAPTMPQERPRPQDLDDQTLCRLWRQSFWELTSQSTPTDYLRVVAWRQRCLDEIERRDAQALHAWFESGARASGGPEKFLRHPPGGATDAA
jgi:hypothetical protein